MARVGSLELPPSRPRYAARAAPQALRHQYVGDWGFRPIVPTQIGRGGRTYLIVVFWFMLVASVELWWLDTPAKSMHGAGAMMTEGGRITGMVAGFLLLAQVLAMSRVRWLERWIGAHDLLTWHRELGAALLILVLAHVVLITFGYASESDVSVFAEADSIWHTLGAMISAYIATAILAAVALLSIRKLRRRMPYELWYYMHLAGYLVLLLSYGHQFVDGQELSKGGFGHWYWVCLYSFLVACLIQGRIIGPITRNLRHRLRVAEVVEESNEMVSIYIEGRRLEDLDVQAGQYFRGGSWPVAAGGRLIHSRCPPRRTAAGCA